MSEIYWITRLGAIDNVSFVLCVLSLIASIVSMIGYFAMCAAVADFESRHSENYVKEYQQYKNIWEKALKIVVPILIVCGLIQVFVPTQKEAFLIYGVGGTIDYVKSNPVAKQLPDKCVNALDKWVDSWTIEEKKDSIKK